MKRLFTFFAIFMAVAAVMHSAPIDAMQAMERLRGVAGTARYASAPLTLVYSGAETPVRPIMSLRLRMPTDL